MIDRANRGPGTTGDRIGRRQVLAGAAAAAGTIALPLRPVLAQGSYLAGETLELLSSYSEGAAGNLIMQEWVRAVGKLLPDTAVVHRNSAGGSSALGIAMVAESVPDGLTVGEVSTDTLLRKYTSGEQYDISDFAIIAGLSRALDVLYATTRSGITSVSDLVDRDSPAVLPVRATVSGSYFQGLFTNAMFGTRIMPVTGYNSGARELAFLSGEAQLIIRGPETGGPYIENGDAVAILRYSDVPVPDYFGDPPSLSQLAVNQDFRWIVEFYNAISVTYIVCTRKDVPADRLEILRDVFMRAADDPDFRTTVTAVTNVEPVRGNILQNSLKAIVSEFGDLGANIQRALACGTQIAETGEACAA